SEADIAKAVAYGKRVKVYPFSQAVRPPETRFADAAGILFDSTIRYDLGFFEFLAGVVQTEPWLARDRAMIDDLRTIRIDKEKSSTQEGKTRWFLMQAPREARAWLELPFDADPDPYSAGTPWRPPVSPELVKGLQTAYGDSNSYPVDDRAIAYTFAFVGIK